MSCCHFIDRLFTYEIHRVRGDATNSAVAHSTKAHVCEVAGLFSYSHICKHPIILEKLSPEQQDALSKLSDRIESTDNVTVIDSLPYPEIRIVYPDVLKVSSNNTAVDQRCIYLKQTACTGARTWTHNHTNYYGIRTFADDLPDIAFDDLVRDGDDDRQVDAEAPQADNIIIY